ncbi:MAG: tetratricopeptide repeat protein, partial [Myxococcota bacterium]
MTGVDADAAYLADEIPASVIDSLANISFLHVIPRSSSFRHRDSTDTIQEIGEALKADFVLTGQIVSRGDDLRIRAELVAIDTNQQLFSGQFDQSSDDTLLVETELTDRIIDALKLPVSDDEARSLARRRPVNADAHAAYLEGRFWWNKRTPDSLVRALELFQKASTIDPQYALAHAGQAEAYVMMADYSHPPREMMPLAERAIRRSMELDPTLPGPHTALGLIQGRFHWDWQAAEASFLTALEHDPNYATAHNFYGDHLISLGRIDEAEDHKRQVLAIDPGSLVGRADLANVYFNRRQFEKAVESAQTATAMDPSFAQAFKKLGDIYIGMRRYNDAIEAFTKANELAPSGRHLGYLGYALGLAGQRIEAIAILDAMIERAKHGYVSAGAFAMVYFGLGQQDRAFEYFDEALDERDFVLPFLKFSPSVDPLRSDPRFDEMIRRIGLPRNPPNPVVDPVEIPRPSVAVLPFEMTRVEEDAEFLADEIPASVIDALSEISFLHVIPRSSSFRHRGSTDTIQEIGEALKADFILTGQIVPRGDDLRIRAELVAVRSNQQLWADRMDRSADDTLALETYITERIIEALKLPVSSAESQSLARRRPVNAEAHAAYLEGRFWWNKRTPRSTDRAIELYDRAIEIDPQFALAYAGKTEAYAVMGLYSRPIREVAPLVREAANTALQLDPSLGAPHTMLATYDVLHDFGWEAMTREYALAIELDPTYATGLQWYSNCLAYQGQFEEARTLMERAVALEPSSMS